MGPFGTIAGKLANSSCLMQQIQKPLACIIDQPMCKYLQKYKAVT